MFTEIRSSKDLELIAERLMGAFSEPFSVQGADLQITASIGGAVYPFDGVDEVTLVKQADVAMYEAKHAGGNSFRRIGDAPGPA